MHRRGQRPCLKRFLEPIGTKLSAAARRLFHEGPYTFADMATPRFQEFLERKVEEYNQPFFIEADPISVPHRFTKKQDKEIAGFFAAIFAWGNRATIINKANELMHLMDDDPYEFCLHHKETDRKRLLHFKHRTFTPTDLLFFLERLQQHYRQYKSLEAAFSQWMHPDDDDVENALAGFHHYFFSGDEVPQRSRKHIATPEKNSSCKRLNMFLRWMVRTDNKGVDFGIWNAIKPSQLVCPLDLHVMRVAQRFNLIDHKLANWNAALSLTRSLRKYDASDPVKFDFALFGLGVMERYQ